MVRYRWYSHLDSQCDSTVSTAIVIGSLTGVGTTVCYPSSPNHKSGALLPLQHLPLPPPPPGHRSVPPPLTGQHCPPPHPGQHLPPRSREGGRHLHVQGHRAGEPGPEGAGGRAPVLPLVIFCHSLQDKRAILRPGLAQRDPLAPLAPPPPLEPGSRSSSSPAAKLEPGPRHQGEAGGRGLQPPRGGVHRQQGRGAGLAPGVGARAAVPSMVAGHQGGDAQAAREASAGDMDVWKRRGQRCTVHQPLQKQG